MMEDHTNLFSNQGSKQAQLVSSIGIQSATQSVTIDSLLVSLLVVCNCFSFL